MAEMTRRGFLGTGAVAGLSQTAPRPNVLFIMTDQQRFDCLGANGNKLIKTPNLDRLAQRSANFVQSFVQAPVCVPSRVSYFTGRYPHSHKNRVNYTPCDRREVLMQKLFQEAGYQTGSVGKLHYYPATRDHALSTGFDRVLLDDGINETDRYSDYVKWRNRNDPAAPIHYNALAKNITPGKNPFRGVSAYEFTPTAWTGRESCNMLRDFARASRPFFLFSSFFKPHAPFTVPEPYDSMNDGVEFPLPERVTLEDIRRLPLPVQKLILRGRPQFDMDRVRLQWMYRSYCASVSMIDREVGRLLDELEQTGKAQDTIVVFASDHGDQLLEHGLLGKNVFFDASIHVPLLISWPGRVRPGRYQELTETIDLMPALLEFCGLPIPHNLQGRSFAPLVSGQGREYRAREAVFAENIIPEVITGHSMDLPFEPGKGVDGILHPDAKMVRTNRWKFTYYPGHGSELYDLREDPCERHNRSTDPGCKGIVDEMKGALLDWLITADESDQIAPRWLL